MNTPHELFCYIAASLVLFVTVVCPVLWPLLQAARNGLSDRVHWRRMTRRSRLNHTSRSEEVAA